MKRFYLVPELTDAKGNRVPKHGETTLAGGAWGQMPMGSEPWAILGATLTQLQHDILAADSEVYCFPENLTTTVGLGLASVRAAVVRCGLAADWIIATMTWRQVIRGIQEMTLFLQRFRGRNIARGLPSLRLLGDGRLATTKLSTIPKVVRDELQAVAADLQLSTTFAQTLSIAEMLQETCAKNARPIYLHGEVF